MYGIYFFQSPAGSYRRRVTSGFLEERFVDVAEFMRRVMAAESNGVPIDWKAVSLQLVKAIAASQPAPTTPESTSQAAQ